MMTTIPRVQYVPEKSADSDQAVCTVAVNRLIESRMLLVANSGAGKSHAIRQLLEETHGHVLQIVFDLEGEFVTLREVADVIIAGDGGDVPAHPDLARTLCRRLLTIGASAVINLYDLKLHDRRRFVRLFLDELMSLPRPLWRPCLVIIDEAHTVCPERGSGEAESTDAVITLCTQGRKRGFSAVLATQRISKLHKDAAAELLNKLIGRTSLDIDVKRAASELGLDRARWSELKSLKPGEFFAYGPAINDDVTRARTGTVRTKPPKHADWRQPVTNASVTSMLQALGDLPALAKEDATSIEQLQEQVTQLKRELRAAKASANPTTSVPIDAGRLEAARADAANQSRAETIAQVGDVLHAGYLHDLPEIITNFITSTLAKRHQELIASVAAIAKNVATLDVSRQPAPQRAPRTPKRDTSHTNTPVPTSDVQSGLSTTQFKMLVALAKITNTGVTNVSRASLGTWCGLSWTGGSFSNNLSALRKAQVMEDGPDSTLRITTLGLSSVHRAVSPIKSLTEIHDMWLSKFGGTAQRMLEHLILVYPSSVSREDLASVVGVVHTGGSYSNNLSSLRRAGVLVDVGRDVRAADTLFPPGLPRHVNGAR